MGQLRQAGFETGYQLFLGRLRTFGREDFRGFDRGLPASWEGYKPEIRRIALERLRAGTWIRGEVGSGRILQSVLAAIEIRIDQETRNNLVPWEARPRQPSATAMMRERLADRTARAEFEALAYDLYQDGDRPHPEILDGLAALLGRSYPLIGYLFFLRDDTCYMPIAPQTFDRAFEIMKVPLRTSGNCSWVNYAAFNGALAQIRKALAARTGAPTISHHPSD